MKIKIPAGAAYILKQLNMHGYEAYIVGGCVRDSLLGKQPNDWDITTSAKPEQVKAVFKKTIDTGIQHGTVTVLVNREITRKDKENPTHADYAFEVTTYRVDGVYTNHRRPESVSFTSSLEEDLKRRDFTINAMAYNPEQGVIDVFGGQEDLAKGIVRCVGCAAERFDEDALRILRAVRFAAQLDFEIEEETRRAMRKQAHFLETISAERICAELTKLLVSGHPERLEEAYELGLTKVFLPELDCMMQTAQQNPYHQYDVGHHTLKVMQAVPSDMVLRYAALLHDVGKPKCKTTDAQGVDHFFGHPEVSSDMARGILRRLKLDNETVARVCRLVQYHDYGLAGNGLGIKSFRRFVAKLGMENFSDFMTLRKADMAGQSDYQLEKRKQILAAMEEMYAQIRQEHHCLNVADLAIGGRDLMEHGISPGPQMGQILNELLERVLDEPKRNTKEQLFAIVDEIYRQSE